MSLKWENWYKRRHENVSDEERAWIEPLLPSPKKTERPRKNTQELVDDMVWIFKTGASWRDLPEYFGLWKTAYNNFLHRRDVCVRERVPENLNTEPEKPWHIMTDSTIVKARRHSVGAQKRGITIRLPKDPVRTNK